MSKKEIVIEDIPKACPMCRSTRWIAVSHMNDVWIRCKRCGKKGPKSDTLQGAIRKWNGDNAKKS